MIQPGKLIRTISIVEKDDVTYLSSGEVMTLAKMPVIHIGRQVDLGENRGWLDFLPR